MHRDRILVCGGRDYPQSSVVRWLTAHMVGKVSVVIHGAARGADTGAANWATLEGVMALHFPANWGKHGRSAGAIRNRQMLTDGKPDLVIAFPGGKGTMNMIRQAWAHGVRVIEPVGAPERGAGHT